MLALLTLVSCTLATESPEFSWLSPDHSTWEDIEARQALESDCQRLREIEREYVFEKSVLQNLRLYGEESADARERLRVVQEWLSQLEHEMRALRVAGDGLAARDPCGR